MKNLFLLLLALFPTMLWADGSGSLFVNNNNGLKGQYDVKLFAYKGQGYAARRMAGDANCYYFQHPRTNVKYLFMDNAKIRFIQGTKSMTDLVIVLRGNNEIECGNHSCIGLEKGNLTIDSEDGKIGSLKVYQTGSYRCIYTSSGSITMGVANVQCLTENSSKACISQEGANGMLTLLGTDLKTAGRKETWIYAKGIKTEQCGLVVNDGKFTFNPSTGYLYLNGNKAMNVRFYPWRSFGYRYIPINTKQSLEFSTQVSAPSSMPNGISLGDINFYFKDRWHSASFKIDGRSQVCYLLESIGKTRLHGPVYFCPTANCFVLGHESIVNNWSPKGIFNMPAGGKVRVFVVGDALITSKGKSITIGQYTSDLEFCGLSTAVHPTPSLEVNSLYPSTNSNNYPKWWSLDVNLNFNSELKIQDLNFNIDGRGYIYAEQSKYGNIRLINSELTSTGDFVPTFRNILYIYFTQCGLAPGYGGEFIQEKGSTIQKFKCASDNKKGFRISRKSSVTRENKWKLDLQFR